MRIGIEGNSEIKTNALNNALSKAGIRAQVINIPKTFKGVEQPVGFTNTMSSAISRALYSLKRGENTPQYLCEYYVAIESGIEERAPLVWVDFACCVILDPKGTIYTGRTKEVIFPTWAVIATRDKPGGFDSNTVGETLLEAGVITDAKDPHTDLARISRESLICDELLELLPNKLSKS